MADNQQNDAAAAATSDEPRVAALKPALHGFKAGETWLWCSCGRSAKQPFCDGSHRDTSFKPLVCRLERDGEALLCLCKRTRTPPFCDGSHNNLLETYAPGDDGEFEGVALASFEDAGPFSLARLDGDCYVARPRPGALAAVSKAYPNTRCGQLITARLGARFLSQFLFEVAHQASPAISFDGAETVLFIASGTGIVEIGARRFAVVPEMGVYVRGDEAFRLHPESRQPLRVVASACPQRANPTLGDALPDYFDASAPERVVGADPADQRAMADRYYQMLVDERLGCEQVSQFIGAIPCSRAAHHRHLYEEVIQVLSGEGYMWTDKSRAALRPGDVVFLPHKQSHSVQCTSPGGMRLVGLFYPAGSPAVNY